MSSCRASELVSNSRTLLCLIAERVFERFDAILSVSRRIQNCTRKTVIGNGEECALMLVELNLRCLSVMAMADPDPADLLASALLMKSGKELEQIDDLTTHLLDRSAAIGSALYESFGLGALGDLTYLLASRSFDAFMSADRKVMSEVRALEYEFRDHNRKLHESAMALLRAPIYCNAEIMASRSFAWHLERIASHASALSKSNDADNSKFFVTNPVDLLDVQLQTGFSIN